jgi:hypothetical protein
MVHAWVLAVSVCLAGVGAGASSTTGLRILEVPYDQDATARDSYGRPCDIEIRYDDGVDDTPQSMPALFWLTDVLYQSLFVRFQPPEDGEYLVERAAWYSPVWSHPGWVDVMAREVGDSTNVATETVWIEGSGTHEIDFSEPICIPSGGEFLILLCPHWQTAGSIGDDASDSDHRSYYSLEEGVCEPEFLAEEDFMIWSCVRPCGPVPSRGTTWGSIKSQYR